MRGVGRLSSGFLLNLETSLGDFLPPFLCRRTGMPNETSKTPRELLLTRSGLVFVSSTGPGLSRNQLDALELELAQVGYVVSSRLRSRLQRASSDEVAGLLEWALPRLLAHVGGGRKHEPLFRSFPDGIPDDTLELYWKKILVHFVQGAKQPCLFCGQLGTTHVLDPCRHVVCDHCFDGASYSACPVCEHHVDRSSPFFRPAPDRPLSASEKVVFRLLDWGDDLAEAARALFVGLCERKQALSPDDRDALVSLAREYRTRVLAWLPPTIPLRENVGVVFGTLLQQAEASDVLPHAQRYVTNATDVLRILAVLSGTDGSLLRETVYRTADPNAPPERYRAQLMPMIERWPALRDRQSITFPMRVNRFKVARLSRARRRALLALLEGFEPDRLVEDMLRHRASWVWVGEFLHPHEYAARFPRVARAFQIMRKKAPDGTLAPEFRTWSGRLEQATRARDAQVALQTLLERPGEFARRFDHALRTAPDADSQARVLNAFVERVGDFATPVLLTLRSHLPTRHQRAAVRVYWPKTRAALGVSGVDTRALLARDVVEPAVHAIDAELLRRFAAKPAFAECVIDEGLRTVVVPFNERTASRSAVALPRGSRIPVAPSKVIRLFLHWCQPAEGWESTDIDLSVGFYDEQWKYLGVCSYYELETRDSGGPVFARSAGDLRDAPWPDGATEFVDLHREPARAAGVRYAVMVVNNYAGMPFSKLERGFAGLMLRDSDAGRHFDPRTVELKFALDGDNGVFLPLVLDLARDELSWLDVHAQGQLAMNDVATSNAAITKICPELMTYFASGVRCSVFELGLLHAAARCQRVFLRGSTVQEFQRRTDESSLAFHQRLLRGEADEPRSRGPRPDGAPVLALLYRGDLDLPEASSVYALFREHVVPTLAASDLLS